VFHMEITRDSKVLPVTVSAYSDHLPGTSVFPLSNLCLVPSFKLGIPISVSLSGSKQCFQQLKKSFTALNVPLQGVVNYYPHNGKGETRPSLNADGETEDSACTTIEVFFEGRKVPHSHAATLPFFPCHQRL